MSMPEYLEYRFREYFRDARAVAVLDSSVDETTTVLVEISDEVCFQYVCTPGSDDDFFVFENTDDRLAPSITIPFPMEES